MVLIQGGPFGSGNASGSLGSSTFSHNRFGQYIRQRTKPVNPQSVRQTAMRASLAALTAYWSQTLTAANRGAWDAYAAAVSWKNRLGETIKLTGFNHFIRSNAQLLAIGETPISAGPTTLELPEQDPSFAIAASEATQLLAITFDDTEEWCDEDGGYLLIYGGTPQTPQRNFFAGPWRYAGNVAGDSVAPPTTGETVATPFVLTEAQKVWCYARILRADGRLSNPFNASALVAA